MRSSIWLLASLLVLSASPPVPLSGADDAGRDGAAPVGRADAPWYDVGWKCRAPLVIDNSKNSKQLIDFQVALDIPYDRDMKPDFSDVRFVQNNGSGNLLLPFWLETREAGKKARAYVNVSSIANSASTTIHMYFGNPSADNASDGPATFLFFDDFEDGTIDTSKWSPIRTPNAGTTVSETGGMLDFSVTNTYMYTGGCIVSAFTLPKESYVAETKLKFTNYWQSAFGAYAGFTNDTVFNDQYYSNPLDLVSARLWDYTKNGWFLVLSADDIGAGPYGNTQVTIRNVWFRMKTCYTPGTYVKGIWNQLEPPYANHSLEIRGTGGIDPNHLAIGIGECNTPEHTYFDHILLRKYASPEPEVTLGAKERPYSFKSFSVAPLEVSERDRVVLSAIIENPVDLSIPVKVLFKEGDEYAESQELRPAWQVELGPRAATNITLEWNATGGNHTFWFVLEGAPVASAGLTVNWVPVLDFIPDQLLMQAIPFSLRITGRDNDSEPLNWSEDSKLFDFKKTDNGGADIAFVPSNDDVGFYRVNFTLTDPHGRSASRAANFTVGNNNDNPVLNFIPDMTVTERSVLRYQANATDPDLKWGDSLTFSDDTTLFEIDREKGNFTYVPTNNQVGKYTIEITVSDNQSAAATRRFGLTVLNFNDPPVIDPIAPQKATQDRLWQVMVTAHDPDQDNPAGDKLRFSDDSPLFNIDPATGLIGFKPANKDVGVRDCNITVTDLSGASATARLSLTVLNVNDPPALDAVDDQKATQDQPFELQLKASDIDVPLGLDNLTFSDDSPLFDIDPRTGRASFTPTNAQVGRHTVRIRVTDETGESASRSFLLTVQNVNDPPVNVTITSPLTGARFWQGEPIWFNATAADIDAGDRLTYTWLDNGAEFAYGKNCQTSLAPGRHLITLDVSDGTANVTTDVEITVAKKDLPVSIGGAVGIAWPALAAVVIVAAAVAAVFALSRRRRKGAAAMVPEAERTAAPAATGPAAGPPAPSPPAEADREAEAKKAVTGVEESLADAIIDGKETSDAEDALDLAREAMKEADFAAALRYAAEARSALDKAGPPGKGPSGPDVGRLKCPGCDEELQPEWPTCPVCGYKTRGD